MTTITARGSIGIGETRTGDHDVHRAGEATALDRLMASADVLARFAPERSYHVVRAGDTLSGIAAANGTTWQTLARINGIADPDRIAPGQHIRLPEAEARATVHVVRTGETLSGIAQAHHTSVDALVRANGIADPDRIRPGQQLEVAGSPATRVATHGARPAVPAAHGPAASPAAANGTPTPGAASVRAADIAAGRAAGHASEGHCYAWVKTALQRSGAVADYMPGVAAKDAGPALEARGFVNLLDRPGNGIRSPYDAPKGAVLVYGAAPGATDGNARYGHIEIRTGTGFASDYASANARTGAAANGLEGRGRVLIGVYVKPDAQTGHTQAAAPATPQTQGTGQVTAAQLRAIMPGAGDAVDRYVGPLNAAMRAHGITTPQQQASFLAQVSVESGDMRRTEENLNYSAERMTQVWPRRFPTIASAVPYAHNPEALANHVYSDRMGNGDAPSGDGYLFRGRGLIQVTGRENYRRLGYENNPDALAAPQGAADSAAGFWANHGLNARTGQVLDRAAFDGVSRTVNGGNEGADARWAAYQRGLQALQAGR